MQATPTFTSPLSRLQERVTGSVLGPESEGYHQARMAWNLVVDQHPAVIVVAESVDDVVEAVRFAAEEGLEIAVQSTGHGIARPANGSLLIITSALKGLRVDAAAQTARLQAGLKWGEVLAETQAVGLAPLLGSSPDVGVVGYTLGGGMGWLARRYGLAADSVNWFEVVTPAGEVVRASETENSDLFWALRGGGGNFGVVTAMEIRLYPVTTVYAGNLFYPVSQAKEVISRYREWIRSAPDELTSAFTLMNFPPVPSMPDFLRGQSFILVRGCYSGPVEEGEALLRFWREWQAPLMDDFKAIPFTEIATVSNDPVDPLPGRSTGAWLRELSDEVIDTLIRHIVPAGGPPAFVFGEVRHAGGAIAKAAPDGAFSNRQAEFSLQCISVTPTPEALAMAAERGALLKQELQPSIAGVYINFIEGEEVGQRTRDAFSADNFSRLQTLKAKYDPQNRFSHSYRILPAA